MLERYTKAAEALPCTRLAGETASRVKALGGDEGVFRHMVPETPRCDELGLSGNSWAPAA